MPVSKVIRTTAKPPAPLYLDEALEKIGSRAALSELKEARINLDYLVASFHEPDIAVELAPLKGSKIQQGGSKSDRARGYHLQLSLSNMALGTHVLPPPIETREFGRDSARPAQCPSRWITVTRGDSSWHR